MTINAFKIAFLQELKSHYPATETESFLYWLTEAFLEKKRLDVAINPSYELSTEEEQQLKKALERLKNYEPIQYIVGETEFFGLPFKVNPSVLIPRPETEELVDWILQDYPQSELHILDIGTGSGCIPISLAKNLVDAKITSLDISAKAIEIAQKNATLNQVSVNFLQQDILKTENLQEEYDVIVSNPPYVRELEKAKMHQNVLSFEPKRALYVKDDNPLIFYEKIAKLAIGNLKKNGSLYFEINEFLAKDLEVLIKRIGFTSVETRKDIYGKDRMLKASI